MKTNFFYAFCLSTGLGCSNQQAEAEAQAEAARVRGLIASELQVGRSEAEIKVFGERHSWHFRFDEGQARFRANVYTTPENTHDVLVFLYVNGKREFVRSEVKIARTSL